MPRSLDPSAPLAARGRPAGSTTDAAPAGRRTLIATAVTARVAGLAIRAGAVLLPELAGRPADLPAALTEHRPHTLVVGANHVPGDALHRWAQAMRRTPDRRALAVIRRGTSLAEIDTDAAAELGVTVRNTPEVNARHVARFMADELLAPRRAAGHRPRPPTVGLIGSGDINSRVAREAVARGHDVIVYSPSLAAGAGGLDRWLAARRLPAGRIRAARDVESVLDAADLLGLAVPLTTGGEHPTAGLIGAERLKRFGGHRIVSVCEPDVFTGQALTAAFDQLDLEVVLDNAPRLLDPVRALLAGRYDPDDPPRVRPGFTLVSAAMRAPECAADLDQAVLTALARLDLDDRRELPRPPAGPSRAEAEAVVVVGGGIVGLTVALRLHEAGRRVVVLDAAPADRRRVDEQGTTFAGTNGRHLSTTETLPHADATRAGVLARTPTDGGWRLRPPESLSAPEAAWAEAFEQFTDRPGMRALATEAVIALNRLGLRRWEEIFQARPDDLGACLRGNRLARVYLDDAGLATGRALQTRANDDTTDLDAAAVRRHWPALAAGLGAGPSCRSDRRSGGGTVEVDGCAVAVHDLAGALADLLRGRGVPVVASAAVRGLRPTGAAVEVELGDGTVVPAGRVVLTVGGRDLYRLLGRRWPDAGCVANVLGVSLTLPNPGVARPLKIHAGDPLGVINVTPAADQSMIHVSGGFGYLGLASWRGARLIPADSDTEAGGGGVAGAVEELVTALIVAIGDLFPALRGPDGRLDVREVRTCERPMTADGLPVVDAPAELGGRIVVAAGTNAGGAVQAPALADLVADLLDGHPWWAQLAMAGDRTGLPVGGGRL
ncbi:FAD-binding oxidoreductase [Parafrankia sp. BMG5.11]|uniref:FAD-binding oxidoreductase n=1 Tax=Parafrankia sp. BMG5.11 TaxID=222540 RepID=UPI00103A4BB1|nr:FAD-binding oxidoreductase [Parafrankia sp. BMG5.11]TCJ36216.1 FAD-dependent oxidoreductase [Parafrankia sp. BMG5.11]